MPQQSPESRKHKIPRINLALPQAFLSRLNAYAEKSGMKPASGASYLLQSKLDELAKDGFFDESDDLRYVKEFVESLLGDRDSSKVDFEQCGRVLSIEPSRLQELYENCNGWPLLPIGYARYHSG